jgi:hypothetical protein
MRIRNSGRDDLPVLFDFQVLGKDRYMEAQAVAATVPAAVWTIWKRNPLSICISWAIFASIGQFRTYV